jgi:hypothetical protein
MFNPTYTAYPTKINDKIRVVADGFLGTTEMVLPMTLGQFTEGMEKRQRGALIQNAFPRLTPEQRDFLISGMSLDDQDKVFTEDNDPPHPEDDEDSPL